MNSMSMGGRDKWEHGLIVAYDVAIAAGRAMIDNNLIAIVESTFTYISPYGLGQLHADQLERFAAVADDSKVPALVVYLNADIDDLLLRHANTGRLTTDIVKGTWHQHQVGLKSRLPVIEVNTSDEGPEQIADRVYVEVLRVFKLPEVI